MSYLIQTKEECFTATSRTLGITMGITGAVIGTCLGIFFALFG